MRRECILLAPSDHIVGIAIEVGHECGFGRHEENLLKSLFRNKVIVEANKRLQANFMVANFA